MEKRDFWTDRLVPLTTDKIHEEDSRVLVEAGRGKGERVILIHNPHEHYMMISSSSSSGRGGRGGTGTGHSDPAVPILWWMHAAPVTGHARTVHTNTRHTRARTHTPPGYHGRRFPKRVLFFSIPDSRRRRRHHRAKASNLKKKTN